MLLAGGFLAPPACLAAETVLNVRVREHGSQELLPCRAWVEAGGKRLFRPSDSSCAPYERDRSFACDGQFSIPVPPGPAVVHVERGKEYISVDEPITVGQGPSQEITIELKRWIDMRQRGWYSADMHVHFIHENRRLTEPKRLEADIRVLKLMALADDVNFVPVLSYWNDNIEQWPDWPEGPGVRADQTHWVTLRNEEIERIEQADGRPWASVGAPLIFGLTRPVYVPGVKRLHRAYPSNAALCRTARRTSPGGLIDLDKAMWAENVVGVALGLFDSMQLCHNHYHRDKTFRMGWGMIGPELEDEPRDWGASEMLHRTNLLYYHWLNCGFRLSATGGSAIGVMPVPTGHSRTYAKLDGPLTEESYLSAIRAGRTFATTGPMLFLTVNGAEVGSSLKWKTGGESLAVNVRLESIQPVESLEVIHNGRVISETDVAADPPQHGFPRVEGRRVDLTPQRSGWVAARAFFRVADGTLHQAHTGPVYITVDDKPIAFRKDAEYMLAWLDRIQKISQEPDRYPTEQAREETQAIYREARAVYESIAEKARALWGD